MNIIIPTDLTEESLQCIPNIIQLFKNSNATITLFHAVEPRTGGSTLVLNVDDIIYEESKTQLKSFISTLKSKPENASIQIMSKLTSGYFETTLNRLLDRTHPDLVIMNSKSRHGIDKILERKQTLKFIGELKQPLLIVPYNFSHKSIEMIGVGVDQKEPIEASAIQKIELFSAYLSASLHYFHVNDLTETDLSYYDNKIPNTQKSDGTIELMTYEDVALGMEEWMKKNNAGVLTLVTHNKNFFSKLFAPGMTRIMAKRNNHILLIITQ